MTPPLEHATLVGIGPEECSKCQAIADFVACNELPDFAWGKPARRHNLVGVADGCNDVDIMTDIGIKRLITAPICGVIASQEGVTRGGRTTLFVEFAGGCVCIGFTAVDAACRDFPMGPVDDKAIVFYQQNRSIGTDGHDSYRRSGIVDHMVVRDYRPVRELDIILVQADPLTLVNSAPPKDAPWSFGHTPLRLPCATSRV